MLPLWLFWHFISSFQDHHSLFHTYNLSHSFPLGICIAATMNVVLVAKTPWMADDTASFLYVICAFLEPHFFLEPSQRKLKNHQQSQMCNWSLPLSRSRSLSLSSLSFSLPPHLSWPRSPRYSSFYILLFQISCPWPLPRLLPSIEEVAFSSQVVFSVSASLKPHSLSVSPGHPHCYCYCYYY